MPHHIVLLGDSIFDNSSYTDGQPDVVSHLKELLPSPWGATLCAIDGATTEGLGDQLQAVPEDASHHVISIGGNDALADIDLLATPVASTAEALALFGDRVESFERAYRAAIEPALTAGRLTVTCTIYNGDLDPPQAALARVALMMYNDVILRFAFQRRLPVIDLRSVCDEPTDYAIQIEPSGRGGRKIAEAIARCVMNTYGTVFHSSRVYAR